MKPLAQNLKCANALLLCGTILASVPAFADKPSWAGQGKGRGDDRGEQRAGNGGERRDRDDRGGEAGRHFEDRHRAAVRNYYDEQSRGGRCPPGLAKKHNGCMPPGQARKWAIGQPLPSDVVRYDVPPPLVVQIGAPPSGYRYVRVATDILMIAVGTGMVVDAIKDLGR